MKIEIELVVALFSSDTVLERLITAIERVEKDQGDPHVVRFVVVDGAFSRGRGIAQAIDAVHGNALCKLNYRILKNKRFSIFRRHRYDSKPRNTRIGNNVDGSRSSLFPNFLFDLCSKMPCPAKRIRNKWILADIFDWNGFYF